MKLVWLLCKRTIGIWAYRLYICYDFAVTEFSVWTVHPCDDEVKPCCNIMSNTDPELHHMVYYIITIWCPPLSVKCPQATCLTSGSSSLSFRVSHSLHCSGCYTHRHAHTLSQHSCRHVHLGHIFKHAWEQAPPITRRRKYTLMMKRQGNINHWLTVIRLSVHKLPALHYITSLIRWILPFLFIWSFFKPFTFTQALQLPVQTHTIPICHIIYSHPFFSSTFLSIENWLHLHFLNTSSSWLCWVLTLQLFSSHIFLFSSTFLLSSNLLFFSSVVFSPPLLLFFISIFLFCSPYLLISNPSFLSYISLLIPFSSHLFLFSFLYILFKIQMTILSFDSSHLISFFFLTFLFSSNLIIFASPISLF